MRLMRASQILRQDPGAADQFGGCSQIAVVILGRLTDESARTVHGISLTGSKGPAADGIENVVGLMEIRLILRIEFRPLIG